MTLVTPLPPRKTRAARSTLYITRSTPRQSSAGCYPRRADIPRPGRLQAVTSAALLPVYSVAPFVVMLLAIAVLPLAVPHWWESNRNKLVVSIVLGLPVLSLYLVREPAALVHMTQEYVSFIILLAALYVISGGILMRGDLSATPLVNSAFLATGSLLASCIGTTGASMLLIRALLQTNRERTRVRHTVIFFIFLVSNIGGMLTPLGDPPLFLGYLQGVPFTWTFRLWPHWLLMVGVLLATYFVWDTVLYTREPLAAIRRDRTRLEPLRIRGALNGLGLAGVVVAVTILEAISVGAVAMGANSYIGNAPNFMVKSIAEEQRVKMPTFFGYMLYSALILLPLFAAVTVAFFR